MIHKKKVLAISGSSRSNSINESILRVIAELYADFFDMTIFEGIMELPHFNPDIEDEMAAFSVKKFREEISRADGVVICTPEYVFSVPGVLKNALEWTVSTTVFSEKPVAIIVASGLGEKTYESLTLIMTTLGARIPDSSRLLIQGARAKFSIRHQALYDQTLLDIQRVMNSFIESMNVPLPLLES